MGAEMTVGGELKHADTPTLKPDFSGWATKFGIECSDGRTILSGAFTHQDGQKVPLVYHHGHSEIDNVLGHVILHDRGEDGVYCDGYFNTTDNGKNAKIAVEHGDLNSLSIYANKLMQKSKQVVHGMIKEVSLVLSGANPGALIDQVQIAHGENQFTELDDEAIIYMPEDQTELHHGEAAEEDGRTIQDVYDSMNDEQKSAVAYMVGAAASGEDVAHADDPADGGEDGPTIQDIYDSMTDEQKNVVAYMVGAALEEDGTEADAPAKADKAVAHSDTDKDKEVTIMSRNVFEQARENDLAHKNIKEGGTALSHDDIQEIMKLGKRQNSLKAGLEEFLEKSQDDTLAHGIHSIESLFPEAKNFTQTPEWDSRRIEWVKGVLDKTRKIPFSRVKTMTADITQDEARAKGYIKGTFKEQEWFDLTHRSTGPTTVYKKQQLDRDDILDITDFDVILWMKGEMRLMLEEELARAILIGDGRSSGASDKIKDPSGASDGNGIRSILHDNDLYAKTETISVTDTGSEYGPEIADRILESLVWFKGTPGPTFYTTLPIITKIMLTRDGFGKRLWKNWSEFAQEIGCSDVVAVEVAETEPDLIGIIVNLSDYLLGNDKGGEVNMFDDFDIDYNQFKYLIETRLSGALSKIRSAIIIRQAAEGAVEVTPTSPVFVESTGVVTIPTITGVTYKNATTNATVTGAQTALSAGASQKYYAIPTSSAYYFHDNQSDEWTFTRPSA